MGGRLREPERGLPLRILLVSTGSGSRGGGEIFLKYLSEGLTRRGHEVIIWMPSHPRMDELAKKCEKNARIVREDYKNIYDRGLRSVPTPKGWKNSIDLSRAWKAYGADIIHINKQNLEDGLDLLRAAERSGTTSVATIHLTQSARSLGARAAWLRDGVARRALGSFRGSLVAVQDTRRDDLISLLGPGASVYSVFNGVPAVPSNDLRILRRATRADMGLSERDFLILGVGRLVPQKRPLLFLDVAETLKRHLPHAVFLWVGDGHLMSEWKREVSKKNLESVVSVVGWQQDVRPFVAAGDLLLHVASYEGFPLAIIEAMISGLPCAIPRELHAEMPLLDQEKALIFEDANSLAAMMMDKRHLASVGDKARQFAARHLSVDAMAERYERIYSNAICKRAQAESPTNVKR